MPFLLWGLIAEQAVIRPLAVLNPVSCGRFPHSMLKVILTWQVVVPTKTALGDVQGGRRTFRKVILKYPL